MIDFRYHLVSLISVFLALAVGIILGAGPLQNAIGDQLTDQVEALRVERTALRDSLTATEAELADLQAYALGAGAELVDGSLEDVNVAVVDVDGISETLELDVVNQLEAAGARVVAQSSMTESWDAVDDSVLRDTVADGQRGRLEDMVAEDATTSQVLGTVLGVALTEADEQTPGQRSDRAVELYQLLTQVGLVDSRFAPSAPADAVLLLTAGAAKDDGAPGSESPEVDEDVDVPSTVVTLQSVAGTVVVAGPTAVDGDLLTELRATEEVVASTSTVSGIEQETMRMNVPLAIAAQAADEVGQYGFEEDAEAVPPVVRAPDGEDTAQESGGTAGDEASTGDTGTTGEDS
ncbi:copper transporter [Isoptericola sp. b515]|uniref:copper transporter n=1 Tax=Isoptericola sp. b515 TaxID=3064652 RepID=UPI002713349F|nr:copper transporter [Isoptericola sp. b515]MDO8149509.1 copper transporter [Isoptericola sp. b515]